ncbi:acetylornithine/succinylornithine family transaminase [Alkalibaculum sp. M08DMB]|uniref:Acetylornithine aminotransferase n=1 Tax=Alkalibaculum sporogenes TaxID=2655001 RepID=A0A6A7KB52_9FIRM|nr:aspartate aminotransferase family protein [Alkalibaculum sporogenes]MPW26634.1 acetylornithine/succinylornithine family transaminase [Alkalibaculum sporogenes]
MENDTIKKGNQYIMNSYARFPIVFDRGEKVYLYDDKGKKYLDFVAGIAVNCLGYANQEFIDAINEQLKKLNHVSNLYWIEPAVEVAEKLAKYSGLDQVFYCNSGAEAVEAAIKLSRIYSQKNKSEECYEIISMNQSFHGRTMGALSLTGQEKYHNNLKPLLSGVNRAQINDLSSLQAQITENTSAIIIEPIQGEGGINPVDQEYLEEVRKICDKKDIVLIFDEVQTGIGRTGELFGFQKYGVVPDIVTCAKGLGNGIPIGAIVAKKKFSVEFTPGTHASTFGGNGIACSAAKVVLDQLMEKGLLQSIKKRGEHLANKLSELKDKFNIIKDVRGIGLIQGIELTIPVSDIVGACMEKGLLLVPSGANVIRFVPPLIITDEQIDEGISILESVLEEI